MRSPSHAGLVGYLMTYYWPHTFIEDVTTGLIPLLEMLDLYVCCFTGWVVVAVN
jgi:hypothetical protein